MIGWWSLQEALEGGSRGCLKEGSMKEASTSDGGASTECCWSSMHKHATGNMHPANMQRATCNTAPVQHAKWIIQQEITTTSTCTAQPSWKHKVTIEIQSHYSILQAHEQTQKQAHETIQKHMDKNTYKYTDGHTNTRKAHG